MEVPKVLKNVTTAVVVAKSQAGWSLSAIISNHLAKGNLQSQRSQGKS